MNKFCTNCGNKLNENAAFCVKCGVATNNSSIPTNKPKQPGKGLGIASMVLGIISTFYSLGSLFIFTCLLIAEEYLQPYEKLAFGFIFLIIPIILLTIGCPLGIASRYKTKNGINLTGLILNIISFILCLLSIAILYIV